MRKAILKLSGYLTAGLFVCSCTAAPKKLEKSVITISANQHGFEPGGIQALTVKSAKSLPLSWEIMSPKGDILRSGKSQVFGASPAAGEHVHTLAIEPPIAKAGTFPIFITGQQVGAIIVTATPFKKLSESSLNYFYLNRAGIEILPAHAPSPKWARPAGHRVERATCFSGTDKTGLKWPGCDYVLDVTGGWYDAGDHGKYAVNGGISVWMLQNAAERMRARGGTLHNGWGDGRASIPEAGNGVPDILDEARWQIEFLLSLQVPDGKKHALPSGKQSLADSQILSLNPIDASGMFHHKVHAEKWPPLPLRPKDDTAERFLMPPSTSATLNVVAVTAQAARLWRGLDDAFAEKCLSAAIKGYEAAKRNPDIYAYDNFDGGGAYADYDVSDEFAWAAIELYAATGDETYMSQLSSTPGARWLQRVAEQNLRDTFWADVDLLPLFTILTAENTFSDTDRSRALSGMIHVANRYAEDAANDGYGAPFPPNAYEWGSNGAIASRSLALGYVYDATSDPKYRNTIVSALDYLLGRNPLNKSYIAGFGDNPVKFVHHRYWGAGADPSFPIAAPGALSGGPNADYPVSDSETANIGKCAPQKCWVDDHNGFSINEVAINWNAALFWLASYLETSSSHSEIITEPSQ